MAAASDDDELRAAEAGCLSTYLAVIDDFLAESPPNVAKARAVVANAQRDIGALRMADAERVVRSGHRENCDLKLSNGTAACDCGVEFAKFRLKLREQ